MSRLASNKMKAVICDVLNAHKVLDFFNCVNEFYVKIENPPFMPLSIERSFNRVCIAHYFKQNGDLVPDPDMEFEIDQDGLWQPVAIQFAIGTYRRCEEVTDDGQKVIDQRERRDQVEFSNLWASNIRDQGFSKGQLLVSLF